MSVEQRLIDLGLELPQPMKTDTLPFDLVRADGNHLYLSGHVPTDLTGKVSPPFGKVGADVMKKRLIASPPKLPWVCAPASRRTWRSGSSRKVVARFRYGEHCTGIHQHSRRDQWLFRYRVSGLWRRCWGPCAQRGGYGRTAL